MASGNLQFKFGMFAGLLGTHASHALRWGFLSVYILLVGPPLLVYTLVSRNPNPLYWAGINGVMFFVKAVGVGVRVVGTQRIPAGTCLFVANHTSSADAPAVVGAIPRRIAILLKESLFKYPIVGQAFLLARFIPVDRKSRDSALDEFGEGDRVFAGRAIVSDLSRRDAQSGWAVAGFQEGRGGDGHQGRRADRAGGVLGGAPGDGEALAEDPSGRGLGGISGAD